MKMITTLEELERLPARSIIAGPAWHDEIYQKSDNVEWHSIGSPLPWTSFDLEQRGPFAVLREGEELDDEERPAVLPAADRPDDIFRALLRIAEFPIGQVEIKPDGSVTLHYAREDLVNQARTLVRQSRE